MTQQAYPIKCRIRAEADVTVISVFEDIGPGGWFSDGLTAKDFSAQMAKVTGPLRVNISSGGGDVFDGIAIANTIRNYRGGPKTTVNDGLAASIASVIFQAGDERIVQDGSMIMIHDAFGMAIGNSEEMAKMAQTLDQVSANLAGIYASRAGGTAEDWRTAMKAETWYTADEAVAAGLADRVGDGTAQLPAGLDVAAFSAVPGRIAAALRKMPQAKVPAEASATEGARAAPDVTDAGPSVAADGTHAPWPGSHSHSHTANGDQGNDDQHDHAHDHDNDADHGHSHGQNHAGGLSNGPGKPYKPAPYSRDADETVQCPGCQKFNDIDAAYCDQCGTKMTGRTDVEETSGPGKTDASTDAGTQAPDGSGAGGGKKGKKAAKKAPIRGAGDGPCCSACGPDCACGGAPAARGQKRVVAVTVQGRTLGAESMPLLNEALAVHHTATADGAWDGPAAVAAMPNDAKVLRYCHAWQDSASDDGPGDDPDGDADDKKASYKFPHHTGKGAAANLAACRNGLARLSSADIPGADRDGVRDHLQAHLDDAGGSGEDAGNHAHTDLAGIDLDQIRAALKGAHA